MSTLTTSSIRFPTYICLASISHKTHVYLKNCDVVTNCQTFAKKFCNCCQCLYIIIRRTCKYKVMKYEIIETKVETKHYAILKPKENGIFVILHLMTAYTVYQITKFITTIESNPTLSSSTFQDVYVLHTVINECLYN